MTYRFVEQKHGLPLWIFKNKPNLTVGLPSSVYRESADMASQAAGLAAIAFQLLYRRIWRYV
jgi:hypothetical protein